MAISKAQSDYWNNFISTPYKAQPKLWDVPDSKSNMTKTTPPKVIGKSGVTSLKPDAQKITSTGVKPVSAQDNVITKSGVSSLASLFTPVQTPPPKQQAPIQQAPIQPTQQQPNYNQMIYETLNQIRQQQPYQYDPTKDVALQTAQDQAMGRVRQDMAKRGRVFDTYAGIKEQEAAQQLIPDYYRLSMNQYNTDRQNLYNQLNAIAGLQQQDFGQQVTQAGLTGQYQGLNTVPYQQTLRGNKIQDTQIMEQGELRDYGVVLSPKMREYTQAYQSMSQDDIRRLQPLGQQEGGFATTINYLRQNDPGNPDLPLLEALRAQKILSNPEFMSQYGAEYGMETGAIEQAAQGQRQQQTLNELEVLKQIYTNEQERIAIEKLQSEIARIDAESAYKNVQAITEQFQALQEQIKAENLPQQLKADLTATLQLAQSRAASAQSSYASAQKSISDIGVNQMRQGLIQEQTEMERARAATERERTKTEQAKTETERLKAIEKSRKLASEEDKTFVSEIYNDYLNSPYQGNILNFLKSEYTEESVRGEFTIPGKRVGDALNDEQLKLLLDIVNKREPVERDTLARIFNDYKLSTKESTKE